MAGHIQSGEVGGRRWKKRMFIQQIGGEVIRCVLQNEKVSITPKHEWAWIELENSLWTKQNEELPKGVTVPIYYSIYPYLAPFGFNLIFGTMLITDGRRRRSSFIFYTCLPLSLIPLNSWKSDNVIYRKLQVAPRLPVGLIRHSVWANTSTGSSGLDLSNKPREAMVYSLDQLGGVVLKSL